MAYYGRPSSSGDVDLGIISAGQQRACVFNAIAENGWVTRIGFWGGKYTGTNVNTRLGLWNTNDLKPNALLGDTAQFSVSTSIVSGSTGAAYEHDIINRTSQPQSGSVQVFAGQNLSVGVLAINAQLGHAMVAASKITAQNEQFYNRSSVSAPTNPNGYTSSSVEGHITAWLVYQPNRTPSTGIVAPSGLQTSTTLTFEGTFSDPDTAVGDRFSSFQFQVVQVSDGAIVHDSYQQTPNSTEIANNKFSRVVGGFSAGVEYKWRCNVADAFGTWSGWSGYTTFTINAGGYVDTFGGVIGKQNTQSPTPFSFVWHHPNAFSANRYQLRIGQGEFVIKEGAEVTISAANNSTISASWSASFSSYVLPWATQNVWWEVRVRDSGNLWTSYYRSDRAFSTDSPPNIPTNLTPTSSAASGTRPKLRCYVTDPDSDALTVSARIKNSSGTVLQTRTMTHVGSGWYEYQTVSGDLASYNTYRWDATAKDAVLWSGGSTTTPQYSPESVFIYANAPTVVVTSPAANATLAGTLNLTWNAVPNQMTAKATVYRSDSSVLFTHTVNTASNTLSFNSSYGFRKGQAYTVVVEITDTNSLTGSSSPIPFNIDYPNPSPITGFLASPEYQQYDSEPSSVRLTWNAYSDPTFERYTIARIVDGQSQAIATITTANQTSFVDLVPPSGTEIEYAIVLTTLQGLDETQSAPVYAQTQVNIPYVTIQNVYEATQRVILHVDDERSVVFIDDGVLEKPWGSHAPIAVYGATDYQKFNGTFLVIPEDAISPRETLNALRRLWKNKQTLCYRDERGRRLFGRISAYREIDERVGRYTVELEFTETAYKEGA